MGRIVFSFLLLVFSGAVYSENRFSMKLEYELIGACVAGHKPRYRSGAIDICICALQKTMEDGFWPDYDNDKDYYDEIPEFTRKFRENIKSCLSDE